MATSEKDGNRINLPPDLVKRCREWAKNIIARYATGDKLGAMPFTRHEITQDELRQWLSSRNAAGEAINIETCDLGSWKAYDTDPYGVREMLGEEPYYQVGTYCFVRSPNSNGWIWEGDLPDARAKALYVRFEREWEAYASAHPDDPYVRRWKAWRELTQA